MGNYDTPEAGAQAAIPSTKDGGGGGGGSLPYKLLDRTHPCYDAKYWRRLRALYEGGQTLLGDAALMREIFPRHRKELESVYEERCKRAYYISYAGEILDHLVAGLGADPVAMALGDKEAKDAGWDDFYTNFFKDCSPAGGDRVPFWELLKQQVLTALQLRTAWTLVDLPDMGEEKFTDTKAQEEAGALDAYAVPIDPECVIDWEEDEHTGELMWALVRTRSRRRVALTDERDMVRERWMFYTSQYWRKYEITYKESNPPKPEDAVGVVGQGEHSFGRVPLLRLCLKPGLWAMNKVEGPARAHFNKSNALDWGEFQSLLPELYEFLRPEGGTGAVIGGAEEDASRAQNQPRGQGYVQVRGEGDDARFVGPSAEAFAHVLNSLSELRDDMHRVLHQMALSVDNSAAAVGRSGESKAQDKASTEVILGELGRIARQHAEDIMNLVSRGRQDASQVDQWRATGAAKFDAVAVADAIEQALTLEKIAVKSQTFQRLWQSGLARAVLGDTATQEQFDEIDKELEENVTAESIAPSFEAGAPGGFGAQAEKKPPAAGAGAEE